MIEQSFVDLKTKTIEAMNYLTNLFPCVKFVPAEPKSPNFVTIYPGTECKSELGMRGGDQAIHLNSACFERGLIVPVHELMHTIGFVHEHNRTPVLAWLCFNPRLQTNFAFGMAFSYILLPQKMRFVQKGLVKWSYLS